MSPESLADQLKQMSLQPAALDRDRLLFEAGRRSVKPSKAWPLVTVMSFLLACTMTVLYWQRQPQQPMIAIATQPEPVQTLPEIKDVPVATEPEPQVPYLYLVLRDPSILNKPISYPNNNAKPTPLLTAGSYLQPDWQR